MIHYCCKCGGACDCWAFDQSHGDVCDGCSDCDMVVEERVCRDCGLVIDPTPTSKVWKDRTYPTDQPECQCER